MKKLQKFFSLILVLLLVTSSFVPAVSAGGAAPIAVAPVVVAVAPATAEMIINGVTVVMAGVAALKIAENLGKTWDNTMKGWNRLMADTGAALTNLIHAKRWVGITTGEGQALMKAVYECYTATSGGGGKKDGKWYFEARLNHGKLEINTERMDETQAIKEMGRGKNIMTLSRDLAKNAVGRFKDLPKASKELKFEGDHNPAAGKFNHLHYYVHGVRLHCWSWK